MNIFTFVENVLQAAILFCLCTTCITLKVALSDTNARLIGWRRGSALEFGWLSYLIFINQLPIVHVNTGVLLLLFTSRIFLTATYKL